MFGDAYADFEQDIEYLNTQRENFSRDFVLFDDVVSPSTLSSVSPQFYGICFYSLLMETPFILFSHCVMCSLISLFMHLDASFEESLISHYVL